MIEHKKQLDYFIQNLRSGNYYDAHEDLELIWFARRFENSDEIRLIKGFINASVSFELYKKGKIEQSKKVWGNYLKYKDLTDCINSPHLEKYHLIRDEIDRVKKSFIK
ncbi:MAG: DUF309 domain-containing protein [Sulfurimonas sp.]|uniref:DUF309 domain-containing protein n=1 Tax=Sulfurimonas sp. TaxID=2022749 RepID=UPI0025F2EFDE|nr:DUF309 domain-containing protein [Sulfurimonas sp.]MCK9453729.1 DUF309 domain-containing protein [Sulfurimonas sp.]